MEKQPAVRGLQTQQQAEKQQQQQQFLRRLLMADIPVEDEQEAGQGSSSSATGNAPKCAESGDFCRNRAWPLKKVELLK